MSYLAQPTSKTEYGVVQVGNYINVIDGIISLEQDLSPNANVTFYNANVTNQLTTTNANITTQLVATSGNIGNLISSNSNITTLVVTTGNITTLNSVNANVSGNLYAAGNLVITSVTPSAGAGINLSNVVPNGYSAGFTVTNTGVLSLIAGPGIAVTSGTGNITISATGADLINVIGVTSNYTATLNDEYIGVSSASAVIVTLPTGVNGRVYYIKDEYGQGSGKITIQPQSGELIDNKTNYIISVPYQCVTCVFRAGTWRII